MKASFIFSALQFVLSVIIGGDLSKSQYSIQRRMYPRIVRLWLLLTLAVVVLIGSIVVMQNSMDSWFLMTFVVAIVVGCMAAVRYKSA
jgi:hypothetical protein